MKKIIIDLDGTITAADTKDYKNVMPRRDVVEQIRKMKNEGYLIVIYTARNMNSFSGNVGKINAVTLPVILNWLENHKVPYDEIIVGKPWCGENGFYIDDRAIRPSEFVKLSVDEIIALLDKEKCQI